MLLWLISYKLNPQKARTTKQPPNRTTWSTLDDVRLFVCVCAFLPTKWLDSELVPLARAGLGEWQPEGMVRSRACPILVQNLGNGVVRKRSPW
jgi:hypothetical protein